MLIMDNSVAEVYVSFENTFRFLPVVNYDGSAPIVNYNGTVVRCQYSRRLISGAYKQNPHTGAIQPAPDRKNFWYI